MRSLFISMVIVILAGCGGVRSQHTGGVKRIKSIRVEWHFNAFFGDFCTTRIWFEHRGWVVLDGDVYADWNPGDLVAVDGGRLILLRGVEEQDQDQDQDGEGTTP